MSIHRRITAIFTAVLLAGSVAACGDSMADEPEGDEPVAESTETAATDQAQDDSEVGDVAETDEGFFDDPEADEEMVIGSEEDLTLVVPAETSIVFSTTEKLSTKDNSEGDTFTMTVTQDVLDSSGRIAIPAGAMAYGRVTAAQKSPSSEEPAILKLAVESVEVDGEIYPIAGDITEAEIQGDEKDASAETAAKIIGGAAAGALLGRILGDSGGDAVKGAVAGAAAGTAVALRTQDGHAELPEGSWLTYRLSDPITIN